MKRKILKSIKQLFTPNTLVIVKSIHDFTQYPHCHYLGGLKKADKICKYMDMATAELALQNATLQFSEPTCWPDQYEGRFYLANYSKLKVDKFITPAVLACCFTTNPINEAQIRTYCHHNETGKASKCVMFEIQRTALRSCIDNWLKNHSQYECYEGMANYSLSNSELNKLHISGQRYHREVFAGFDLSHYLSLLLLKRKAFSYEGELRFMLVAKDHSIRKGSLERMLMAVNWPDVIRNIYVDDDCDDEMFDAFTQRCAKYGISSERISRFNLYEMERTITIQPPKSKR